MGPDNLQHTQHFPQTRTTHPNKMTQQGSIYSTRCGCIRMICRYSILYAWGDCPWLRIYVCDVTSSCLRTIKRACTTCVVLRLSLSHHLACCLLGTLCMCAREERGRTTVNAFFLSARTLCLCCRGSLFNTYCTYTYDVSNCERWNYCLS